MKVEDRKVLPANIYKLYESYCEEQNGIRKLQLLLDVFKQIVHFFGCVFLSEYFYSEGSDTKINEQITRLSRPSLGSWFAFVREYAKIQNKSGSMFIEEFFDCIKKIYGRKNFEKIYSGRFCNEDSKSKCAFDLIIELRNTIAHGAMSPTEEEAKELVEVYDQYLEVLLEEFSPVFENYAIVKAEEVEDNFDTITVYFNFINYDVKYNENFPVEYSEEEIQGQSPSEYLQPRSMYLFNKKNHRLLKFAEYLLEIMDDNEHEDYYLYDGFGNKKVTYIGMKYRRQLEQYLDAIKSKFTEKGASTKWNRKVFDFEAFGDYVNELTGISVGIHTATGKYNSRVYVERECDFLLKEFLKSDKTTMVVTAEAGVGKTNFLCHSAETIIENGGMAYFYNGNTLVDVEQENLLFRRLQNDCLDEKDFKSAYDFLKYLREKNEKQRQFVLIVDAVNEAYDIINILREIDTITSVGEEFPWLKIIVSIRTVSFRVLYNRITDGYGKKVPFLTVKDRYYSLTRDELVKYEVEIEEWNIIQVINAFEKYRIENGYDEENLNYHNMNRELQNILRNPLNMGLFFVARKTMPDLTIDSEEELFATIERAWYEHDEVTACMKNLQTGIINEMLRIRKNEVDSDFVMEYNQKITEKSNTDIRLILLSPFERLRDTGILLEKENKGIRVVAFVYQKYLEYQFMKGWRNEKLAKEKVIEMMLESRKWDEIPEVYIACAEYLKKMPDIAGTTALIMKYAKENGILFGELQTILMEMWQEAIMNGQIEAVIYVMKEAEVLSWALSLAIKLYRSEEGHVAIQLLEELRKQDFEWSIEEEQQIYYISGLYRMQISDYENSDKEFEWCIQNGTAEMKNNAKVQHAKNVRKLGSPSDALQLLEEFLEQADEDTPYFTDAMIQRGLCKYALRKPEEALKDYYIALDVSTAQNDHYNTLYNELGISTVLGGLGRTQEAEKLLLKIYRQTRQYGYINLLSDSLNGLSANFLRKGEYKNAVSYAKQGLVIWKHSNYYIGQLVLYSTIIKALTKSNGKKEEIESYIKEGENILPLVKEKLILDLYREAKDMYYQR